jgi:hypothetical protein
MQAAIATRRSRTGSEALRADDALDPWPRTRLPIRRGGAPVEDRASAVRSHCAGVFPVPARALFALVDGAVL